MISRLFSMLDPTALLSMLSSILGVPKEALAMFATRASADLQESSGIAVPRDSLVRQLASGDLSLLKSLYSTLVGTPAMWPTVSTAAAEWLRVNDANGIAMAVLQNASKLPFKGFEGEFKTVQEFLQNGVFPMLQEASVKACDHCGLPVSHYQPDVLTQCEACGYYQE